MKKRRLIVIIAVLGLAMIVTRVWAAGGREEILGEGTILYNPYVPKANRYKGQLHCHSGGERDAAAAVETAYLNAGYDFVAITDHDFLTPDPGVGGILHIDGVEESTTHEHIISIDPDSEKATTIPQQVIDAILSDHGIPAIAHPNLTNSDVEALFGYLAIEVYNGFPPPHDNEAEDKWDTLLSKGRQVWGFAVDDLHGVTRPYFNTGWVTVFADSLTIADIVAALKSGNFYSSTGPTLSISLSGEMITIVTDSPSTIEWIGEGGEILRQTTNATTDSFIVDERYRYYIRARIIRNSDGKKAWSNPFYTLGGYKYRTYLPLVME